VACDDVDEEAILDAGLREISSGHGMLALFVVLAFSLCRQGC
jgi:hypothetical protein